MSLLRRCDRCGEENMPTVGKVVKLCDFDSVTAPHGGTDLCDRCVNALKKWLERIPRESAAK